VISILFCLLFACYTYEEYRGTFSGGGGKEEKEVYIGDTAKNKDNDSRSESAARRVDVDLRLVLSLSYATQLVTEKSRDINVDRDS
jgi:hypothetical protein